MDSKRSLTKILAIVGALLVWFPLLAPILFSTLRLSQGVFRFDYLIPAELFPFALLGGILLLWAAWRIRSQQKLIGWGLATAVVAIAGSQLLAVVSGLASGETLQDSVWWTIVLLLIVIYILALVAVGIGGIRLLRDLFKPGTA